MGMATHILRSEHEAVLSALATAEHFARQLAHGSLVPAEALGALDEFLELFLHTLHHQKEEKLLAILRQKGERVKGCASVALSGDEEGFALFRRMKEAAEAGARGSEGSAAAWAEAAPAYAALVRQHVNREDSVLLPMADRLLSEDEQRELAADFAALDARALRSGIAEQIEAARARFTQVPA